MQGRCRTAKGPRGFRTRCRWMPAIRATGVLIVILAVATPGPTGGDVTTGSPAFSHLWTTTGAITTSCGHHPCSWRGLQGGGRRRGRDCAGAALSDAEDKKPTRPTDLGMVCFTDYLTEYLFGPTAGRDGGSHVLRRRAKAASGKGRSLPHRYPDHHHCSGHFEAPSHMPCATHGGIFCSRNEEPEKPSLHHDGWQDGSLFCLWSLLNMLFALLLLVARWVTRPFCDLHYVCTLYFGSICVVCPGGEMEEPLVPHKFSPSWQVAASRSVSLWRYSSARKYVYCSSAARNKGQCLYPLLLLSWSWIQKKLLMLLRLHGIHDHARLKKLIPRVSLSKDPRLPGFSGDFHMLEEGSAGAPRKRAFLKARGRERVRESKRE
ncbi:uncharacterized protein CLUP02_17414 [Colletotrichum lupini]|uniref:Uncharacterized protein n=1 Tax=Colletotrichum lupini TaxID=145971 RepID=A0A9Q8WAX6_9PEZI|nr:uncharacterized protein CLUP02_17414 [Colletotrichum lupini]UQC75905.1 hypothetical protein CLUP02_17414 [Colletotrichum lupini]